MFGKKKTRLGIRPKVRTLNEINADYNFHAAQAGHKVRIIREIEAQVLAHQDRLAEIHEEAGKLPKETKDAANAETPATMTAGAPAETQAQAGNA